MAEYWWKETSHAPAQGPVDAQRLRELAASGQITPDSRISQDGITWHRAAEVKNLFGETAAPDAPEPSASGPAEPPPAPPARAIPAAPMHYYTGAAHAEAGTPGKIRNLTWFLVCGIIVGIFGTTLVTVATIQGIREAQAQSAGGGSTAIFAPPSPSMATDDADAALGFSVCFLWAAALGMFIYWLVWIYQVHAEIQRYTGGRHSVSPGQALGFSFIPLFNLFWNIYMPYQLATTVRRLKGGQGRPNPGLVLTLQILAIFPGCCVYGLLTPIMMAIVAYNIQEGLNDLWRQNPAPAQPVYPHHA